ncbi:MAG TPA: hypothetical protein VN802_09250 [Stellaceae bacterium]|nr:hypothetical protein [Stellaceae bacterium]
MKRLVPIGVVVFLALMAGACANWAKPGGTPDMLAGDRAACDKAASAAYPPDLGPGMDVAAGGGQPSMACVPNRGCITTGTGLQPGGALEDRNGAARGNAFDQCMMQHGWSK